MFRQSISIDSHIEHLEKVIRLMQDQLAKKNGRKGRVNFGNYSAPVKAFDNDNDWSTNSQNGQVIKTVPGILKEGIQTHNERIAILLRMKEGKTIEAKEHELLMKVSALAADFNIAKYTHIRISYSCMFRKNF